LPEQPLALDDHAQIARVLGARLEPGSHWRAVIDQCFSHGPGPLAHLAVFTEPYLDEILAGRKTVESRFARNVQAPHGVVAPGDLLLLKHSSGPLVGLARVGFVHSYVLDPDAWRQIREQFATQIRPQGADFWEERRHARFATLMQITEHARIAPVMVDKQDRRGWVALRELAPDGQLELLDRAAAGGPPQQLEPRRCSPAADCLPVLAGQQQLSLPGTALV
jgi:ASCH domain